MVHKEVSKPSEVAISSRFKWGSLSLKNTLMRVYQEKSRKIKDLRDLFNKIDTVYKFLEFNLVQQRDLLCFATCSKHSNTLSQKQPRYLDQIPRH